MAEWLRDASIKYSPALSKYGSVLIGTLVSFVTLKYLSTGTNPFRGNSAIALILIAAILIHVVLAFLMKYFNEDSLILSFCICLVSGMLAFELLLFISVIQVWKFVAVNVSLALLIAPVCFYKKLSILLSKCWEQTAETRGADEQQEAADVVEMTGVQVA